MRNFRPMKRIAFLAALIFAAPLAAEAACFADYKAKQDNPLRLHYGVIALNGTCTKRAAAAEIAPRIGRDGWQLLNVLGVFDDSGLAERKDSAGRYYLRY